MKNLVKALLLIVLVVSVACVVVGCDEPSDTICTCDLCTGSGSVPQQPSGSYVCTCPNCTDNESGDEVSDYVRYYIPSGADYAVVMGYESGVENIVIASEYKGKPVKIISGYAFDPSVNSDYYRCAISSITIPKSITHISRGSFRDIQGLVIYCEAESKPDAWPKNWNYGDYPVVWDCKNNDVADNGMIYTTLNGVTYGIKDNEATVTSCGRFTLDCEIPSSIRYKGASYSVITIGDSAFSSCYYLKSVTIPGSVTTIGEEAFCHCYSLTSVTIPDSVTTIGRSAFSSCDSLFVIYCKATEKPSGWNTYWKNSNYPVIWNCDNNEIAEDGYIHYVSDGIRYGIKDGKATVVRYGDEYSNSVNILASISYKGTIYSVTTIGDEAFYYCYSLESITIPDSVTTIGDSAFSYCSSLTSVTIPDSVTTIGNYAFYNCYSLASVTIGNGVETIGGYVFFACSSLENITFNGTKAEWNAISKDSMWDAGFPETVVHCSDGDVEI